MRLHIRLLRFTFACAVTSGAVLLWASHAHLNYPDWWQPAYETEVIVSPPPPDLDKRLRVFATRNSDPAIERLAREFFDMMDVRRISVPPKFVRLDSWGRNEARWKKPPQKPPTVADLLAQGEYRRALEAYREFFFDRLSAPPPAYPIDPVHPGKRSFVEFIHVPEELLRDNVARFTMLEHDAGKGVVVRLNMGPPGRVNWTWYPSQYETYDPMIFTRDGSFMVQCVQKPHFYNNLLTGYLETGDKRYLQKWSEFVDDRWLNFARDARAAGFNAAPEARHEKEILRTFSNLMFIARSRPQIVDELPAPTLARLLLEMWAGVPTSIRVTRETSSNRSIEMYSTPYFNVAVSFPEFHASQYALREKLRVVESFPTVTMMPDGSDIENSEGYNGVYLRAVAQVRDVLMQIRRPTRIGPQWFQELRENMELRANYLLHHKANNGWEWYPAYYTDRYAQLWTGNRPGILETVPSALEKPENKRLIATVFEDGGLGEPEFRSEAWPYGGQYIIREHWGKDAQQLYMQSPRPHNSHTWKNSNDIQMFAFGQPLLTLHTEGYGFRRGGFAGDPYSEWTEGYREELRKKYNNPAMRGLYQWEFTPVFVDDCPQLGHEVFPELPFAFRSEPGPQYGKFAGMAHHEPLPNRWHESDRFNMAEGEYAGPFANAGGEKLIRDVSHRRQVLFLRQAGLWIIADRLRSRATHRYKLDWKPAQPFITDKRKRKIPGFTPAQVVGTQVDRSVKTSNPDSANVSIYMHSPAPLKIYQYGAEWSGEGHQLVLSAIYPRRTIREEVRTMRTLSEAGIAGFTAELPGGSRVWAKAALNGDSTLEVEDIRISGEALILVVSADGSRTGLALGCRSFAVGGAAQKLSSRDFEFGLTKGTLSCVQPIYKPLPLVEILPPADHFAGEVEISMRHPEPDVSIRYTLDGSEPGPESPLYAAPLRLRHTTTVKARAFRAGVTRDPGTVSSTEASVTARAVYTSRAPLSPKPERPLRPGLQYTYWEGDWRMGALVSNPPSDARRGTVRSLLELPHRTRTGAFTYVYSGFFRIPRAGVYSLHAPREMVTTSQDCGYDLRLWLGSEEWYPATRLHNHGNWSVPLDAGIYPFRVVYVDQRGSDMSRRGDGFNVWQGERPDVLISGPGLEKQTIPAEWLGH